MCLLGFPADTIVPERKGARQLTHLPARLSFSSSSCTSPPHSLKKSDIFMLFTREGSLMRKNATSFRISSMHGSINPSSWDLISATSKSTADSLALISSVSADNLGLAEGAGTTTPAAGRLAPFLGGMGRVCVSGKRHLKKKTHFADLSREYPSFTNFVPQCLDVQPGFWLVVPSR